MTYLPVFGSHPGSALSARMREEYLVQKMPLVAVGERERTAKIFRACGDNYQAKRTCKSRNQLLSEMARVIRTQGTFVGRQNLAEELNASTEIVGQVAKVLQAEGLISMKLKKFKLPNNSGAVRKTVYQWIG